MAVLLEKLQAQLCLRLFGISSSLMLKARQSFNVGNREPQQCGSSCLPGIPESVLLDFFDAEPLHVWLAQAEELDEVGAIYIAYILGLDRVVPAHLLGDDLKVF